MSTTNPAHRGTAVRLLTACVALALTLVGVRSAGATVPTPNASSTNSSQVSFAGTAFASEADENVDVIGRLHLVTALSGSEETGWSLDWQTNVDQTSAIGQTSGDRYVGHGTDSGTVLFPPGPPTREASFEPTFTLFPPGPPTHPPSPIRLSVQIALDETGQVTEIGARVAHGPLGTVD